MLVLDTGTYTQAATVRLTGTRRIIGRGATPPLLQRSGGGPIVTAGNGVFSLEFLRIEGATGGSLEDDTDGAGVLCPIGTNANIRLVDVVIKGNESHGLRLRQCTVSAFRSTFMQNGAGIAATDTTLTLDGCSVFENTQGLDLDAGAYTVTNNFVTRNTGGGVSLFLFSAETGQIEFNTIVANGGAGFTCTAGKPMANNIIAGNTIQSSGDCSFPNSVVSNDIAPLMFVSPLAAPFDFHIQSGSLAIDAATITTIDHDFDGDARPANAADVGADEL